MATAVTRLLSKSKKISILQNQNIQNVDFVKSTYLFDKIDILNVDFVKSTI